MSTESDAGRPLARRGDVRVVAKSFDGLQRGVIVVESIWPGDAFEDGVGKTLTGRLQMLDAREMSWTEIRLSRQADCPVCANRQLPLA